MGIIERNLEVFAQEKLRVTAMFDSGSSFSYVDTSVINKIGYLKKWSEPSEVELGDGSLKTYSQVVLIGVKMNKNTYFFNFYADDIPDKMIIGADFLQKFGHTLEFRNDKLVSKNMKLKNKRGKYVL